MTSKKFFEDYLDLHCYKQSVRLDRIRSLGVRLQSLVSLAHKDFKWCFTMSLLEIFEMILDFDLMNPMRYIDDFENLSAIPDHIIQSLILEVSGIFETYYRSLISFSKYLSSFSFVDDEFESKYGTSPSKFL